MNRKQLEDFLALIAEIRSRNCVIPEEVFELLKEAGVFTESGELAEPYRGASFVP